MFEALRAVEYIYKEKNMKNTRKLLTWILVAVLVVLTVALVACVDKPEPVHLTDLTLPELKDNQMAVIIKNGDNDYTSYVVTLGKGGTDAKTAEEVIQYLHDEADLYLDWKDGTYGKYLNGIGGAKPQSSSEWVTVLTNDSEFQDNASAYKIVYTVDDVTLVSATVGITELTVKAGTVIYFEVVK